METTDRAEKVKRLGDQTRTERGFALVEFVDSYGVKCSMQASSLAEYEQPGTSAIWLGSEGAARMHLKRNQVEALANHLEAWLESDTGDFE